MKTKKNLKKAMFILILSSIATFFMGCEQGQIDDASLEGDGEETFDKVELDDSADAEDIGEEPEFSDSPVLRALNLSSFSLGLQIGDSNSVQGEWVQTSGIEFAEDPTSEWACDDYNCYDPNRARLEISTSSSREILRGKDFKVCMQASDGRHSHTTSGGWSCTPWASQGGGTSGMATDENHNKPDSYRLKIVTMDRQWNHDDELDFRLRLRPWNNDSNPHPESWGIYTPWLSDGGGYSGWATVSDPTATGFEIEMEVKKGSIWQTCTSQTKCGHGVGDCDYDVDCKPGLTCLQDAGGWFGYASNVDVCYGG